MPDEKNERSLSKLNVYGRFGFALVGLLFAVCILIQVFLAGLAVFVDKDNWGPHATFIHVFEIAPILMFILSFVGRVPSRIRWHSLGLLVLIILQYVTAAAFSGIWLAALHPVIAVLLFWYTFTIVKQTCKWLLLKQD